jgi:DNA (cytosine-5)-methyltransferase 1
LYAQPPAGSLGGPADVPTSVKLNGGTESNSPQASTFVEFFAGIGLIHAALAPLGWRCLLANDNVQDKVLNYRANYPETAVSDLDIRKLLIDDIPTTELATASFPCIDLSQAGGRVGINGDHSGIVWSFLDHIAKLVKDGRAPRFLFLENVAGLLTLHGGASIDLLLNEIVGLGYAIDVVQVDARHFTPQARNRVFIMAVRDWECDDTLVMPDTHIRRYKVREVWERNPRLPWIFFDFPPLPGRQLSLAAVLEDLPEEDPRWWDEERMDYFWHHLEHDHRPRLEAMVKSNANVQMTAMRRGRRRRLREQIFNLRFDDLASCLRTAGGGSSIQFVVRVRNGRAQVRKILGVESARLQGVALPGSVPDFVIPSPETTALNAFGDAVCVPAVRWVFENSLHKIASGQVPQRHGQLTLI